MHTSKLVQELCETDSVFRALSDEKRRGWNDENVDQHWRNRVPTAPTFTQCLKKIERVLQQHDDIFKQNNWRFLDIGCAPGGLCSYLVRLGWSGLGVSLSVTLGGLKMEYTSPQLGFLELDMAAADAHRNLSTWLDESNGREFDFINMGVVIPYRADNDNTVSNLEVREARTRENGEAYHPIFRNSLLVLLERLKNGGSCMWTVRESNVAELLRVLDILRKLFTEVRFVFTVLVNRSPFYLLCRNFQREGSGQVLEAVRAQSIPLSPEQAAFWRYENFDQAREVYDLYKEQLQRLWQTRFDALREERNRAQAIAN